MVRSSTKDASLDPSVSSGLLSVDMGLNITSYQLRLHQPSTSNEPNQRARRIHVRAPLRPLISTKTTLPSPLMIHAHGLVTQQEMLRFNERPSLIKPNQQLFVEQYREEPPVSQVNEFELDQNQISSMNLIGYRLTRRRMSNTK
jgi:hypothetical protein